MLTMQEVAARFRAARNAAGLTQYEAAAKAGIARQTIGNVEREVCHPGIFVTTSLAKTYGVSVEWLCGMEDHGEKVVFFHTVEQLQAMTGLDHDGLWGAGFDLNARELRHFFSLRCCNRAQWEIRQLADEMLRLCKEVAPVLFANAGAGCVRGACPEGAKSCGRSRKNEV